MEGDVEEPARGLDSNTVAGDVRFQEDGQGTGFPDGPLLCGKFQNPPTKKDGFPVAECINGREKRLMKYLAAILSPERPNRITVTLANTIFGALSGDRKVDWGVVMRDQIKRLVGGIGKSKPSPITPFLYHLYQTHGWLTNRELDSYDTAKAMSEFEIEDPDEEAGQEEEDSEADTIPVEEAKSQWRRQDRKDKDLRNRRG